jgi:hypothetical protein
MLIEMNQAPTISQDIAVLGRITGDESCERGFARISFAFDCCSSLNIFMLLRFNNCKGMNYFSKQQINSPKPALFSYLYRIFAPY